LDIKIINIVLFRFFQPEDSYEEINDKIKRGDIVGVVGKPGKIIVRLSSCFVSVLSPIFFMAIKTFICNRPTTVPHYTYMIYYL
jgi:hypothetical protein